MAAILTHILYYISILSFDSLRKLQVLSTGGSPPGDVTARQTSASDADCLGLSKKQNVLEKNRLNQPRETPFATHL